MDTFSHALWGGAAALAIGLRYPVTRTQVGGAMAMGLMPDVVQAIPVAIWALGQAEPMRTLASFALAVPGRELAMPATVEEISHHLHCAFHSLVVVALVTLVAWRALPAVRVPLSGWWLHILVDIPTHSASYYAVPFLYPITSWGLDGIAWTKPWMIALNYTALALTFALIARARRMHSAYRP